jgi:hypothetical protein
MPTNDALHGGQADAGSLELLCRVKALERTEKLACEAHIESRAVVSNEVHAGSPTLYPPELNFGPLSLRRELPGVADQVLQYDRQEACVAIGA